MKKLSYFVFVFVFVLFLSGCTSVDSISEADSEELKIKESLLLTSGDQNKLIEFYKENLNLQSNYKVNLVNLYLEVGDLHSAELYLQTYTGSELEQPDFILTQAKIFYHKQQYNMAEKKLKSFRDKGGQLDEFYLLNGRILSALGQYPQAIKSFEDSRKFGVQDKDANNNIAVVEMMRKEFYSANRILENLYQQYPNDSKIVTNYLLTLVNIQRFDIALKILKRTYSDKQAMRLLNNLIDTVSSDRKEKNRGESLNLCIGQALDLIPNENIASKNRIAKDPTPSDQELKSGKVITSKTDKKKIYRVQLIAATRNRDVTQSQLNRWQKQYGRVYLHSIDQWRKYSVGEFSSYSQAVAFLKKVDIDGAFIVNNGHLYSMVNYD